MQTRIQFANDVVTGTGIEDPNSLQADTTKATVPASAGTSSGVTKDGGK